MKGCVSCLIFTLLAAVFSFSTAGAQEVSAPAPLPLVASDSTAGTQADTAVASVAGPAEAVLVGVARTRRAEDQNAAGGSGGVKDRLFGTRTRTANTLIIGGVGVGTLGVAVVKGHAGAIMGVAGLMSVIGGLYTHFR